MKYAIVIEKAPDSYAAYAPDLPGCVAAAETRAEVIRLMREGIALHLDESVEGSEPVPVEVAVADTEAMSPSGAREGGRYRA